MMESIIAEVKSIDYNFGTEIEGIVKNRKILLELRKSDRKRQQANREVIHWFLLDKLIDRPADITKFKKTIRVAMKKGRRVPLSLYADLLSLLDDKELASLFVILNRRIPDWLADKDKEIKVAARVYAKMTPLQRRKISESLKKYWRKVRKGGRKLKESRLAELLREKASEIDPMYFVSLLV